MLLEETGGRQGVMTAQAAFHSEASMDTPQPPADTTPLPVPDQIAATTGEAGSAPTSEPAVDVGSSPSIETEQPEAEAQQQVSMASHSPANAPEPDLAPAHHSSAPVSAGAGEDPSEGNAEANDAEGATKAFDPEAFDEALKQVLSSAGGELLFRFTEHSVIGEKIAAVRFGDGEARLIALVILPPHGDPLRVEPVEDSENPLAPLAKSYASLVDAWEAAA